MDHPTHDANGHDAAFLRHLRALEERDPMAIAFIARVVAELERMELDERAFTRALALLDFCREHPDFALLLAIYAQTTRARSGKAGPADSVPPETPI